jgi:hypothetical protein
MIEARASIIINEPQASEARGSIVKTLLVSIIIKMTLSSAACWLMRDWQGKLFILVASSLQNTGEPTLHFC